MNVQRAKMRKGPTEVSAMEKKLQENFHVSTLTVERKGKRVVIVKNVKET